MAQIMVIVFSVLGILIIIVIVIVSVICVKRRNIKRLADRNRLPPVIEDIDDDGPLDNISFHVINYESTPTPTPEEEESTEVEIYVDPLEGLPTVYTIAGHGTDTPLGDYPEF
eukprot:gnl/Chilomastix_caulleri/3921.p1 GENE.gnl/Chilomastix_caulleri/3921~~gnl/Chilomastix_caulleri/3921.p1  ORF type:complete len:113 (+),score=26.34 gnl/Chilomastix_caulleri/3921:86-424(+)